MMMLSWLSVDIFLAQRVNSVKIPVKCAVRFVSKDSIHSRSIGTRDTVDDVTPCFFEHPAVRA